MDRPLPLRGLPGDALRPYQEGAGGGCWSGKLPANRARAAQASAVRCSSVRRPRDLLPPRPPDAGRPAAMPPAACPGALGRITGWRRTRAARFPAWPRMTALPAPSPGSAADSLWPLGMAAFAGPPPGCLRSCQLSRHGAAQRRQRQTNLVAPGVGERRPRAGRRALQAPAALVGGARVRCWWPNGAGLGPDRPVRARGGATIPVGNQAHPRRSRRARQVWVLDQTDRHPGGPDRPGRLTRWAQPRPPQPLIDILLIARVLVGGPASIREGPAERPPAAPAEQERGPPGGNPSCPGRLGQRWVPLVATDGHVGPAHPDRRRRPDRQ